MDVQGVGAMRVLAMTLQGARQTVEAAQANPLPASEQAAVILTLSTAAAALITPRD